MPFASCWYHLIWATRERQPVLIQSVEPVLYAAIRSKCSELKVECHAVNSVADHVHLAARMPPTLSISEFMRHIKGASSYALNTLPEFSDQKFRWQEGYGALTFSEKGLPMVVSYIQEQKNHHARNSINAYLERVSE